VSKKYISKPKRPFRYISCFSGIEAASVAWDPLGWEPAAFCEIEPFPSAVLAQRYPHVPNLGDITKVNWDEWKDKEIDLIIGGSPCQSFSVAGKRLGLDDPRGNLAIEFIRIIDTVRPTWFILENVAGLLSSDGGRDFGALLALMGECGYGVAYRVLDSQHFGVPQRRRRVFVVGHLGADWRHSAAVLFESNSLSRDSPKALRIKSEEDASRSGKSLEAWGEGIESPTDSIGGGERRGIIGIESGQARSTFGDDVQPTLNCQDDKAMVGIPIEEQAWGIGGGQADQWGSPAHDLCPTLHAQSDCSLTVHTVDTHEPLIEDIPIDGWDKEALSFAANSRDEIRIFGGDGDRTGTLTASDGSRGTPMIAQDEKVVYENQFQRMDEVHVAPTLNAHAGTGGTNVPIVSHDVIEVDTDEQEGTEIWNFDSKNSNSMKSSNPDSGVQKVDIAPPLTTFAPNPALNNGGLAILNPDVPQGDKPIGIEGNMPCQLANTHSNEDIAATVMAGNEKPLVGVPIEGDDVKAFTSKGDGAVFEADVHPTLSSSGGGQAGQGYPVVRREMIVRRLTPLECERLQGFPDNWTRISWNGKPESECPDGHRYKACGNSMAVPVIRWLGERIEAVDAHVPHVPMPEEKSRVVKDFKDGVVVAQDTMDEWFS
jgi:DNA (cytosine-5)-methyltransferase 1